VDAVKRSKRSADFNGISVSIPTYGRLMGMQKSALRLDTLMRQMVEKIGKDRLVSDPKWAQLVTLRRSLEKLMPDGHDTVDFEQKRKRGMTMDFNGMQVSYPTYLRLQRLKAVAEKLDVDMIRLQSKHSLEDLEQYPEWQRLVEVRKAMSKLLPISEDMD
jgi:hypothetical protein